MIVCKDCNREFFGESCFSEHKRNRGKRDRKQDIVCKFVQKCPDCERLSKNLSKHICGFSVCPNCREYCDMKEHRCFILKKPVKGGNCTGVCNPRKRCYPCRTRSENYAFLDFETMVVNGKHVVNLAVMPDFGGEIRTFRNIEKRL